MELAINNPFLGHSFLDAGCQLEVKMWSFLNSVGAAIARLRLAQKEPNEARPK